MAIGPVLLKKSVCIIIYVTSYINLRNLFLSSYFLQKKLGSRLREWVGALIVKGVDLASSLWGKALPDLADRFVGLDGGGVVEYGYKENDDLVKKGNGEWRLDKHCLPLSDQCVSLALELLG